MSGRVKAQIDHEFVNVNYMGSAKREGRRRYKFSYPFGHLVWPTCEIESWDCSHIMSNRARQLSTEYHNTPGWLLLRSLARINE